jgi:hypothetical protein
MRWKHREQCKQNNDPSRGSLPINISVANTNLQTGNGPSNGYQGALILSFDDMSTSSLPWSIYVTQATKAATDLIPSDTGVILLSPTDTHQITIQNYGPESYTINSEPGTPPNLSSAPVANWINVSLFSTTVSSLGQTTLTVTTNGNLPDPNGTYRGFIRVTESGSSGAIDQWFEVSLCPNQFPGSAQFGVGRPAGRDLLTDSVAWSVQPTQ